MASSPTKTFMNWINVSITPQSGTPIPVVSVTNFKPMRTNKVKKFYGDNRAFAAVVKATERERGVSITGGDVAAFMKVPEDTPCTVVGTLLDPRNGATAGGGAITVTLNNAILEKDDSEGKNNDYASGTITFTSSSLIDQSGAEIDPMTVVYL